MDCAAVAPIVSPNIMINSPLFSKDVATSSPSTSALVAVLLVVGLHVGVLFAMVASHTAQSQSPLI